ncbi:MFS transporter [Neobacillus drentensis]|uniref:MFS transporter n=1 Tax=Neobacillus drentensis TaxID=220684 RepID=UPI003002B0C9
MINRNTSIQRWLGVITLLAIVIISYIDRINVSILITNEEFLNVFNISNDRVAQGELMTLFLVGYGIAAMFLTPMYEAFLGVRKGLIVSICIWAIFTIISPFSGSLFLLLFFRFILGASEGPLFSLKTMYIKDEFGETERGKPNAVSSMGVSMGLALGFPLITYFIFQFNWHTSFYLLGFLNLVVGLPLILMFIKTKEREGNKVKLKKRIQSDEPIKTFISALKTPGLIWILVIEITTLSYLWGSSSWLPTYLLNERHFSIKQMGFISSLPFIVSIGSGFFGGYLIDKISIRKASLLFVVGGVLTALCVTITVISPNRTIAALGLVLANGFWGIQGPVIPTMVQFLSKGKNVGSTYGIVNGIGNLVSAFMPVIMGALIAGQVKDNFAAGFSLLIGTQIVTAICGIIFFFYKKDLLLGIKKDISQKIIS